MISKRNGEGQTECFGCKKKGRFALNWDSFLYNYNDEAYCLECLMEELEKLTKENQQLKEELNKYTDPEDLTLMFMYCDEKAKDKIKCLEQENKKYKEVINKLSKSIDGHYDGFTTINEFGACNDIIELLLEIKDILKEVE